MTMAGRMLPIVPGFSESPDAQVILARSYPAPAAFPASRAGRLHGSSLFEAHQMWFTVVSDYLLELGLLPTDRYLPAVTGSSSSNGLRMRWDFHPRVYGLRRRADSKRVAGCPPSSCSPLIRDGSKGRSCEHLKNPLCRFEPSRLRHSNKGSLPAYVISRLSFLRVQSSKSRWNHPTVHHQP